MLQQSVQWEGSVQADPWELPGSAISVLVLPPKPSPALITPLVELKVYGELRKCQLWLIIYPTEKLIQENTHIPVHTETVI